MPPINYAWIIFFLDCVKCLMLIPLSIQYPLLSRDESICILSKWVFSQRFINLMLPTGMKTLTLSCDSSTSTVTAGATGKARRRSVLITYTAVNLPIEKHPRKRRKYQGVSVNSLTAAAACVERKNEMMRQKQRWWWKQREAGVGVGLPLWPDLSRL